MSRWGNDAMDDGLEMGKIGRKNLPEKQARTGKLLNKS
jgi:hypothetical protein